MEDNFWRKCIVCKNEINFSTKYYKCSVSSCDKKRSPAQFCSVECWDVHRSIMSHKSAGADEYQSPNRSEWLATTANERKVRIVSQKKSISPVSSEANTDDILVVVSKLKAYVKDASGLNTSSDVMPMLSDIVREACDKAFQNADKDERKTLMARDFKK
jgi:hypothetical protein